MARLTDFAGWIPALVVPGERSLVVEWCRLGTDRFESPFHRGTVEAALRRPFNQAFRRHTAIEALAGIARANPGVAPTAFVFHASRCGSTLVMRMLMELASHVVLSEPELLDFVLHGHPLLPPVTEAVRCEWFRAMVAALGQRRAGGETRLVVKLDPLNIACLPLVRRAFPGTPWIFIYRNPVEIAVSQLNEPAARLVPGMLGPSCLFVPPGEAMAMPREEYAARVIGGILALGAAHCEEYGGVPVEYRELPGAVGGRLAQTLGVASDGATRDALQRATSRHAKRPERLFVADSYRKQAEASPLLRAAIEVHAMPHYLALEAIRERQGRGMTINSPENASAQG